MANKTAVDGCVQGTLQRGKACLRCRKRKMRCDGAKPACQQCFRAKKVDGCEYDDGKGKTRTQLLRENINRLEQRIRELEDPEYISPSVTLYDPHASRHHRSESSSSSLGSPGSNPLSTSHSPFPSESASSPQGSWTHLPVVHSPSPSSFGAEVYFEEPQPQFQPPFELAQMLLDIFSPHRHQCGLEINMQQLRDSLSLPTAEQRHPALLHAIFLWACFVSRPEPLCQHEEHYLARALEALNEALRLGDRVIDVIQASCLISLYFLASGRILEGSYHASAAAALAVQCGLHGGISREGSSWLSQPTETFGLRQTKSGFRDGERILAFWQVYNLDRCWSVVLHKPSIIPDGPDAWNSINCPWPQNLADYQSGQVDSGTPFQTIRAFLDGDVSPGGFSTHALRVKASALFGRADQLSKSWDPTMATSAGFREEIQVLEQTLSRFIPALIPVHQLDATMPEDKHILIVTHTLAHAAMIHLYHRFAEEDPISYNKRLRAARGCVTIIKHITDGDFDFLDPIIGPCWTCAVETLIRELESSWPLMNSADVRNEIGTILYAMTSLSTRFPILAISTSKIQKRLAEL